MGLGLIAFRAAAAAFFVFAAIFTYAIGSERSALEVGTLAQSQRLTILKTPNTRLQLQAAVQENAGGDHSGLIETLSRRAPLDATPYEVELSKALTVGDLEAADLFAEQALARQPRSLAARLYALSLAAQSRDYETVISEYQRLVDLRRIDGNILADALVGVFRAGGNWEALTNYASTMPATGGAIAGRLMNEEIEPELLEPLIALYPNHQSNYLNRLIRDGAYSRAYSAWQRFSNVSAEALATIPFNPSFASSDAPKPFNWSISNERVEMQSRGGLYVAYLGTGRPRLVNQITAAPPGDYDFKTVAIGRMPEDGGSLEWRLTCLESRERLATLHLSLTRISQDETFETVVTVPDEACAFQNLELYGRAGEFPKTSRIEILSVQLSKFSN